MSFRDSWRGREVECYLTEWFNNGKVYHISFEMRLEVDGHRFVGHYSGRKLNREELIERGCLALDEVIMDYPGERYIEEERERYFKEERRLISKDKVANFLRGLIK